MKLLISKSVPVFIISPLLSLYFIIKDIYNHKKAGYIMLAFFISLLSYFYIPSENGDKSYYFNLYNYFSTISYTEGLSYIRLRMEDFTFYYLILVFSYLGISFSLLSGLITGITVSVLFYIFYQSVVEKNVSKFMILFLFISLLASISLPPFFSGLRFYFALSFVILGMYFCFIREMRLRGILFLVFASTIHWSVFVFIFLALFYLLTNKNFIIIKGIYLFSFLFLFASQLFFIEILDFLPILNIDTIYLDKYLAYVAGNEFVITNTGHAIYVFFGKLWYYLITFFAIINLNRNDNKWLPVLFIALILANITIAFPYIFNRYGFVILIIFLFVLVNDYKTYKYNYSFAVVFFIISISTFSLDILIQRDNFKESYMRVGLLSSPTMVLLDPTKGKEFYKGNL